MTGFRKFLALVCCALLLIGGFAIGAKTCNEGHVGGVAAADSSCCGTDCGCCREGGGGCDVACSCSVDPDVPIEPEAALVVHRSSPMVAAEAEDTEPRARSQPRSRREPSFPSRVVAQRFVLCPTRSLQVVHSVWRL